MALEIVEDAAEVGLMHRVLLGLLELDGVAEYLPAASLGGAVDSTNDTQTWARSVSVALGWTILASVLALLRTRKRDIT